MGTEYAVKSVFLMEDKFSIEFEKAAKKFNSFGESFRAFGDKYADAINKKIQSFGGKTLDSVLGGLKAALPAYIDYEAALRSAGAAFSDMDPMADNYEEALRKVGATASAVAATTEFDAVQAANAMATFAKAGIRSTEAISLLAGTADIATASGSSLDESVAMMVGGLNILGKMSDVPDVLSRNMKSIADMMVYTADSANMSIVNVSEALQKAGSFFTSSNNDMNTFSASLTALANAQITGSEAGTALKNIMSKFPGTTKNARAALEELHVQTTDAMGNLLALPNLIGQLQKGLMGMGDAEQTLKLNEIFGTENLPAVRALLATGEQSLLQYKSIAESADGSAAAKANAIRKSLQNKIELLKSALAGLGNKFWDSMAVSGGDMLDKLTVTISNINMDNIVAVLSKIAMYLSDIFERCMTIVNFIVSHQSLLGIIFGAVFGFKTLAFTIGAVSNAMKTFNTAKTIFGGISDGITIAQKSIGGLERSAVLARKFASPLGNELGMLFTKVGNAALSTKFAITKFAISVGTTLASVASKASVAISTGLPMAFNGIKTAVFAAGVALKAFWVQSVIPFLTNPITLTVLGIVAAVALLAVGIYNLVKHWDAVCAAMQHVGDGFVMLGGIIADWAVNAWGAVSAFFVGIGEGVAGAFSGVVDGVSSVFGEVLGVVSGAWEAITSVFQSGSLLAVFESIGSGILSFVLSPLERVLGMLTWVPFVGDDIAAWQQKIIELRSSSASSGAEISPTKTMAETSMYSEKVSSTRLEIGVEKGVSASAYGSIAPDITVERRASGF